jgi:predicted flap endonuclease-1-like 5' DNA nuclease
MVHLWNVAGVQWVRQVERLGQAQQDIVETIPWWLWILAALIVIVVGVLWTLYEEDQLKKQLQSATALAPASAAAVTPAAEVPAVPALVLPPEPDDLEVIIGIGPKIRQILNEQGIVTFEQLANTEVAFLERLLEERGWRMADPATWPEQAQLLAEQKRSRPA